jgi:hypothetical protein
MSQTPIELSTNCLINTKSLLLTTSQIIDLQLNLVSGQLYQFLEMIDYVTFALKMLLYNSINDNSPSLFQIFIIDKLFFFLSFFLFIFILFFQSTHQVHISLYLTKAIGFHYSKVLTFFDTIMMYL